MKENNVYPNQISIREYGLIKAQEKIAQEVKEQPIQYRYNEVNNQDCRAFINMESLDLVRERIEKKINNNDSLLKLTNADLAKKLIFINSHSKIYFDNFSSGRLGRDNIIGLPVSVIDESELPIDTMACVYLGNLTGDSKKDKRASTHVINSAVSHPLTMSVGSQIFIKPESVVTGRISTVYNRNSITSKHN